MLASGLLPDSTFEEYSYDKNTQYMPVLYKRLIQTPLKLSHFNILWVRTLKNIQSLYIYDLINKK